MNTTQTSDEWVDSTITAVVGELQTRAATVDVEAIAKTALAAAIESDGARWFQRMYAECESVITRFNHRLGRPALKLHLRPSGIFCVVHGSRYVLVAPILSNDALFQQGARVDCTYDGESWSRYYRFSLHDEMLLMGSDGVLCGPEVFARKVLEPWLRRVVPTNGR